MRAALWLHFAARTATPAPRGSDDPNALMPAEPFAGALREHASEHGEDALRALGRDYARLWGRTFGTLVRHMRGRPEQALHLFASEVYPFRRGDRRAARLDTQGRGRARLVLETDLPAAYLEGLVEAFVGLSGAQTECRHRGQETFEVRHRVMPPDRMARILHQLGAMRVPFVLAALVAALVGAAAARAIGQLAPLRLLIVLGGTLAVQAGGNALHDLRSRADRGPFQAPLLPAWLLWATIGGGYAVGAAAGLYLMLTGTPWVAAWAAAGLLLSLLYALVRDQGLGPLLAGITYGPLVATGALHAFIGFGPVEAYFGVAVASLPLGLLAAAVVYVNDLADRPLDQAAGRRTLVVRLPRQGHLVGYAALVLAGGIGVWAALWWHLGPPALGGLLALAAGAGLAWTVRHHLDDPRGLAPARLGTLTLHLLAGLLLALATALGSP
jgi:1,4-dihydroxy-2-naphthoate polyprenyltransferase